MNGYLLDTHTLLWWLDDPELLSPQASQVIGEGTNAVYFSAAAAWEMAIKKSLGRLDIPGNLIEVLRQESIVVLPVHIHHALAVADLPAHHQDPFDRVQIAQARIEGLTLVTRDQEIRRYDVACLSA